jgi:hypothetical protein
VSRRDGMVKSSQGSSQRSSQRSSQVKGQVYYSGYYQALLLSGQRVVQGLCYQPQGFKQIRVYEFTSRVYEFEFKMSYAQIVSLV